MEIQYTRRLRKIEAVLDEWLPEEPTPSWLRLVFGNADYPPQYAAALAQPGRDLLGRGGKRWRPLLMMLIAECIAGERGGETALPLTPLVEFTHNASLIHDDIEDNSDERRGKPAVHLIYGTDTAINSGAFMYFLPLACLSAWEQTQKKSASGGELIGRIWAAWASHMRALHLGQAMDISWHRDFNSLPGLDEYDRMCRLKTGCLAHLAAVLGSYCGISALINENAESSVYQLLPELLGSAAEQLGVGFQILDDVKNLDTGVPGKKRGDDIVEGKKSLPVLLYLHRYPEKASFAARCFTAARERGTGADEVEEFIDEMKKAGVLEEARQKGRAYIDESRRIFSAPDLAGVPLMKEARELLAGLVDSF